MSELFDGIQTAVLVITILFAVIDVRNQRKGIDLQRQDISNQRKEMHEQQEEIRRQSYMHAFESFADVVQVMIENPALHPLYDGDEMYRNLPADKKQRVLYCDWIIAIGESVWNANEAKRIDVGEWPAWLEWLVWFHRVSEDFRQTWDWVGAPQGSGREYSKKFVEDVQEAIRKDKGGEPSPPARKGPRPGGHAA